eukprot:9928286-Karenia_brevis.AAC.1
MLHYWDGIPWTATPTHEHLKDMSWILVTLDYIAFTGDAPTKDNKVWRDENILKLATTFKHATGILSLNDPDLIFECGDNRRLFGALPTPRAKVSMK